MIDALLFSWNKNGEYTQKLIADIPEDRITHQPTPGVNHPAWILSHLIAYHRVIVALIQDDPFDDPKNHKFGMQSKPESDPSIYNPKPKLISTFTQGHQDVTTALGLADPARLDASISLPRWKDSIPNVGIALGYLMLLHESTHLGQLSAWRRVQGMPSV